MKIETVTNNKTAMLINVFVLLICVFFACSQARYGIKNSYVYTQAIFPGNVRVNKTGGPGPRNIDTTIIVYIETQAGVPPPWNVAWQNGTPFSIALVPAVGDSIMVGLRNITMKPVLIYPQKGNRIWQVRFTGPQAGKAIIAAPVKNKSAQIVLGEKQTNRKFYLPLANVTELVPQKRP